MNEHTTGAGEYIDLVRDLGGTVIPLPNYRAAAGLGDLGRGEDGL